MDLTDILFSKPFIGSESSSESSSGSGGNAETGAFRINLNSKTVGAGYIPDWLFDNEDANMIVLGEINIVNIAIQATFTIQKAEVYEGEGTMIFGIGSVERDLKTVYVSISEDGSYYGIEMDDEEIMSGYADFHLVKINANEFPELPPLPDLEPEPTT